MDVRTFYRFSRTLCGFFLVLTLVLLGDFLSTLEAATYTTDNFVVTAQSQDFAQQVGETAERSRYELALLWLGKPMPQWSRPCPIRVEARPNLGAGGETSFTFADGEVFDWKMKVQGSEERILDSVIPHEISHTILATFFRKPVPRWVDEGAATAVEAEVERNNYRQMLIDFMKKGRAIPFNTMVRQKEYPRDQMPFYAQGFSVCEYLILVGGHQRLVEFIRQGLESSDWSSAVRDNYGYENLGDLQVRWQNWVSQWYLAGMPSNLPEVERLASYNPIATPALTASISPNTNQADLSVATRTEIPRQAADLATGRLIPVAVPLAEIPLAATVSGNIPFDGMTAAPLANIPFVAVASPNTHLTETVALPISSLRFGVGSAVGEEVIIDHSHSVAVAGVPAPPAEIGSPLMASGYQGSYGRSVTVMPSIASESIAPPIGTLSAEPRILGQSRR